MKRLILVIAILFSVNSFAQEMEFKNSSKWVDFGIWQIPSGVDTSALQSEWKIIAIDEATVKAYFAANPEKYIKELKINDSTVWINRDRYRWVVYENLSRQVQVLVRERMRVVKKTPQAVVDSKIRYYKILEYLQLGYSQKEIRYYIDSVYYGVRTIKE